jgi:ubiquinone/menaquinone biosynthesis C-methylase UbiE
VAGSRALEVGCGAGLTSIALARQGYFVEAVDSTVEMVDLTRAEARRAGVSARLKASVGDAVHLEFPDAAFRLVMAVGVIPWIHSELQGLREMARVLESGGHLIVTADNSIRLNRLIDPISTPLLAPVRVIAKRALATLARTRPAPFHVKMHHPRQFDRMIAAAGLQKIACRTIGFGPFTCFGTQVLTDRTGIRVHSVLQRFCDRKLPVLAMTGSHYLLLARKTG